MGRIVVGVDGSQASVRALAWAVAEAERRQDDLEAIITWQYPYMGSAGFAPVPLFDPDKLAASAAAQLDQAIEAAIEREDERSRVARRVIEGSPAASLVEAATGADLLVVGSRGHGGLVGTLLGSVSYQCLHHARCPVVVVRP